MCELPAYKIAFELKEINILVKEILVEMFNILRETKCDESIVIREYLTICEDFVL